MSETAFSLNLIKPKLISPLDWTEQFILSAEDAEKISEPDWIYQDLIIQGHVIAIVAEPNGGKTTLLFHIAGEMAKNHNVFYVNADVAGGDAKSMVFDAKKNGFTLMLPDFSGLSMQDVVNNLASMNELGGDFSDSVFIFDTLKKMTDMINKSKSKELYQLLRSLSAKGMTIILLGHTNKHKDADGNPMFEGTGDLRADVDELIYLIPEKHADGSMTVSTKPDKVRGAFNPISFVISPDREVSRLNNYVDTALSRHESSQTEKDGTMIDAIIEALCDGKFKHTEITEACRVLGIGRRTSEAVLKRYMYGNKNEFTPLWKRERAFANHAWNYQLLEINSPLQGVQSEK